MKYSPPRPPSPLAPPPPADREPCTAAPRVARPSSDLSRFSTDLTVPSRSVPRGPPLRPVSPSPSRFRPRPVCAPRNILDYSPVTARYDHLHLFFHVLNPRDLKFPPGISRSTCFPAVSWLGCPAPFFRVGGGGPVDEFFTFLWMLTLMKDKVD